MDPTVFLYNLFGPRNWVEEIFIGTKCTTGIVVEVTLLQTASHLEQLKQT